LKDILKSHWKPVFAIMENGQTILSTLLGISTDFIEESFQRRTEQLKEPAGYIWQLQRVKPEKWAVSNWSKHVKPCAIQAAGTDKDKLALPAKRKQSTEAGANRAEKRVRHQIHSQSGGVLLLCTELTALVQPNPKKAKRQPPGQRL
jgi:hypothetical protein